MMRPLARTLIASLTIGLLLVGFLPTSAAQPPEAYYYNIGLDKRPDHAPGQSFHGASVVSVNTAIDFITVRTHNPSGFEARAAHDPHVTYISQDRPDAVQAFFIPDDPHQALQWGWGPTPGIDAYAAWDVTRGSTSVIVAVLDTGLEKSHEDIGNYRQGYDFINNDNDPNDRCGHGTHVAGTVGALTNNGVGVAGTSESTILPVKVLDKWRWTCSGSFSAIANGITWAVDQGADVLSLSLGCDQPCSDASVSNALAYAAQNNALAVCAAGNSNGGAVGFPASDPNCMAVSALNKDGTFASYSSKGSQVEIAAPGTDIASTYTGNQYAYLSGTSMATPHVSGVAALLLAHDPTLSASDVRNALKATAVDLGLPAGQQGSGALNAAGALGTSGGGTEPTNTPPVAAFTYACSVLSCSFDASTSSDADGAIASYDWDFGDGTTGPGAQISHEYAAAETYTVRLTVVDDDAATDSDVQSVTVIEPAPRDGIALEATAYKVKGLQKADLSWSGAQGTNIDIYLEGAFLLTTANNGAHTHHIDQRGGGSYSYQVCEESTTNCSNMAVASF